MLLELLMGGVGEEWQWTIQCGSMRAWRDTTWPLAEQTWLVLSPALGRQV